MGQALEFQTELLRSDKFELYWPEISRQLDTVPHIWSQWYTKEAIHLGVLRGEFDVWCVGPSDKVRLVVFTRLHDYATGRVLHLSFAFGQELEKCLPNLTATLEAYAHHTGCVRCEIIGRRGWEKILPGFKETGVILSRNLEHIKVQ